jgi:hypothetical protein
LRGQYNAITAASLAEVRAKKDPNVIFGYTANYAWRHHEKVGIPFGELEQTGIRCTSGWKLI